MGDNSRVKGEIIIKRKNLEKKKISRLLSINLVLAILLTLFPFNAAGAAAEYEDPGSLEKLTVMEAVYGQQAGDENFSGGRGTEESPYLISTRDDLERLAEEVNASTTGNPGPNDKYFRQTADINLKGSEDNQWTPIGSNPAAKAFNGYYDGAGYNISGLYINNASSNISIGLFGNLSTASIENVNIISPSITVSTGMYGTGALAGMAVDSAIISCTVQGGSITSNYYTGGLVGHLQASTLGAKVLVQSCYTDIDTTGTGAVGIGGIIGYVTFNNASKDGGITVKDCYSAGDVHASMTGRNMVGGIVGQNNQSTAITSGSITIENCYAAGEITGISTSAAGTGSGGIVGTPNSGTGANARIKNNVAVNKGIENNRENPNDVFGRISGVHKDGSFTGNIAWDSMKINGYAVTGGAGSDKNGEDRTMSQLRTKSTWEAVYFNFTDDGPWEWDDLLLYPKLRGLKGQDASPFPAEGVPPSISSHPQSITVTAGSSASFSVTASGDAETLEYRWQSRGNEGIGWEDVAGVTGAVYAIASATEEMSGRQYRCVVSDKNGRAESDAAALTVMPHRESAPEGQLIKAKAFYENNRILYAPLEAAALYGAGVSLEGYDTSGLTESAYYLEDNASKVTYYEAFEVKPGGISVQGQLAQLILDCVALGKDPSNLNGVNYVHELNKYQNQQGRRGGGAPSPHFKTNDLAGDSMALLGLRSYWGTEAYPLEHEYPRYIGEGICLRQILNRYPQSGYITSRINGMWGLSGTAANRLAGTFWMLQGLWACADSRQLTGENIGRSMDYMDSEYGRPAGENVVTASCELTAAYIMSRLSAGREVAEELWADLAAFQMDDGSYRRNLDDEASSREATALALLALGQNADPGKKPAFSKLSFTNSGAKVRAREDMEAVEKDAAAFAPDIGNLKPLPLEGEHGAHITWSSSDERFIEQDGTVHAPAEGRDLKVILTAVFERGSSFVQRVWELIVEPQDKSFNTGEKFQKLKGFYQDKHTLDTALEPLSILSAMGGLEVFGFDLPYYNKYYSYTGTADRRASEALAALDTMARGGNPRDYTRNIPGTSKTEQVDLIQLILDGQKHDGTIGYDGGFVSDSQHFYYTLALEAYFKGKAWGNEQDGTGLGREGAIRHIFSKMLDYPRTGGRAYSEILEINDSSSTLQHLFWYQCDLVILLSRLTGDDTPYDESRTIGEKAREEMEGLLKTLEHLFTEDLIYVRTSGAARTEYIYDNHNGVYTEKHYELNPDGVSWDFLFSVTRSAYYINYTIPTARYISALVAAGQADKAAEYGTLDRLRHSCNTDGSYGSVLLPLLSTSTPNTADNEATSAVLMALGDLYSNKAILSTISFDTGSVSDEDAVRADLAALSVPDIATANLLLALVGGNGSAITWVSGNPRVVSPEGIVIRPVQGEADMVVTLIATAARGGITRQRVFSVRVPAVEALSDEDMARADLEALTLPLSTIRDISLPGAGSSGSIITWSSGAPRIISDNGAVTRPAAGSGDAGVELAARAVKNGSEASKTFYITIPAVSDDIVEEAAYAIREQYNTNTALTRNYWEVFAARSVLEKDFDKYGFTLHDVLSHRQTSPWQATDYSAIILQILSSGENPYNYKGNNYVQGLLDFYDRNGGWGIWGNPIWAGMALDAAGAEVSDGQRQQIISFCKTQLADLGYGPDLAGWSLITLAGHLEADGVKEAIAQLKEVLKKSQVKSGDHIALFNTGEMEGGSIAMSNGCVVSGFQAITAAGLPGFDLTDEEWLVNGVSLLDTLYNLEIKGKDSFNTQLAVEFGDVYYGDSVWRRVGITVERLDGQIKEAKTAIAGAGDIYTVESLETLEQALEAAETVRQDSGKMSRRVFGKEYFALRDATEGLVERGTADIIIIGGTDKGIILPRTALSNITGKSVVYIASNALNENNLAYTLDDAGGISSIDGLQAGDGAAWYGYVNGKRIDGSIATTMLEDGAKLVFKYCADTALIPENASLGEHIVAEEADILAIEGDLSSVTGNLILPKNGVFGSVISWESSNAPVLSEDGVVERYPFADMKVRLTAKVSSAEDFGYAVMEKLFDIIVIRLENPGVEIPAEGNITVTFMLIGDTLHGEGKHTSFKTWIRAAEVTVPENSLVYDVFVKVLNRYGLGYVEKVRNYISKIQAPDGYWLGEYDNGPNSGWMYTVNGTHPLLGLREYVLKNGDEIVWHYTDDYTKEEGSEKWNPDTSPEGGKEGGMSVNLKAGQPIEGKVIAVVDKKAFADIAERAEEYINQGQAAVVNLNIELPEGAQWVEVQIPAEAAEDLGRVKGIGLKINFSILEMAFDAAAVAAMTGASAASGSTLYIEIKPVSGKDLLEGAGAYIGSRPAYELGIRAGSKEVSSFEGGRVQVGIAYKAAEGENKNAVILYHMDDDGELTVVKNCRYDDENGLVLFFTEGLGRYGVGYNSISFTDTTGKWMQEPVEYMAARGMINGVGENRYAPDRSTTRGEFVTMLMQSLEPAAETSKVEQFIDVEAGKYYSNAVLEAKALGLVYGVGEGRFNPHSAISRQEMFAITYRALDKLELLEGYGESQDIAAFTDMVDVAGYAEKAVDTLAAYGLINGSNGKLYPKDTASRAECARFFYNILTGAE